MKRVIDTDDHPGGGKVPAPQRQHNIKLGLCCKVDALVEGRKKEDRVFAARTMTLAELRGTSPNLSAQRRAALEADRDAYLAAQAAELVERALQNCRDLATMLEWVAAHNIRIFRISSDLLPRYTAAPDVYTEDVKLMVQRLLRRAGDVARTHGIRITMHPDQYNVVGTPEPEAFRRTCESLDMHAQILDWMEMGRDSVMVVHGGGVAKTSDDPAICKRNATNRWIMQFSRLPERVKLRLVLECCENSYSIRDCLEISWNIANHYGNYLPVVLDLHHYDCYLKSKRYQKEVRSGTFPLLPPTPEIFLDKIMRSWKNRGIKIKMHVSQQAPDKRVGAHADYVDSLPQWLLDFSNSIEGGLDLMVEAKAKEKAVFKLREWLDRPATPAGSSIKAAR